MNLQQEREILIVSTRGGNIKKLQTAATTWGEVASLIENEYDLSTLKAVENIGKTTLEHPQAALPTGNFRVFLRPVKVKSGYRIDFDSMTFAEIQETIKSDDEAKDFLNAEAKKMGKNWTQLTLVDRKAFLKQFYYGSQTTEEVQENQVEEEVKTETQTEGNINQADLVEAVKESKEERELQPIQKDMVKLSFDMEEFLFNFYSFPVENLSNSVLEEIRRRQTKISNHIKKIAYILNNSSNFVSKEEEEDAMREMEEIFKEI